MTLAYADLRAEIMRRVTVDADGCWIVAACDNGHGYQSISRDYAHRHMYRFAVGPIPDGYEVDHLCHKPACARPACLEAVTPTENKRRAWARQTHCKHGHELPAFVGQRRACGPCHAQRERLRKARIRAAKALTA